MGNERTSLGAVTCIMASAFGLAWAQAEPATIQRGDLLDVSKSPRQIMRGSSEPIEVIFTKIPGHPSSIVPGALDAAGDPVVVNFRSLGDLVGSPDGTHWLLWASTHQVPGIGFRFIILGSGDAGTIVAQEELQVPESTPGILYDFFPSGVGRFNDYNDFAFTARSKNGPAETHQRVMVSIDGEILEYTREGEIYIGLLDQFNQPATTAAVGNSVGSVHLLNDGTVGSLDPSIKVAPGGNTQMHSSRRPAIFYKNIAFYQNGVSTVMNLDGTGQVALFGSAALATNTFITTPDSDPLPRGVEVNITWMVRGTINEPTGSHHVIIRNGRVVIQQGNAIPGSSIVPMAASTSTNPFSSHDLLSNGDWYVRGVHDSGTQRWAVRNGEVFAVSGDPVPGSTEGETWVTFNAFSGDRNGNWYLIGQTDLADTTRNEVVVVNGEIVLRKGDQVFLDGHAGDIFLGRTNPASAAFTGQSYLSEDGMIYLFSNLHDGAGNEYNSDPAFGGPNALIRKRAFTIYEPCPGDLNGDGFIDEDDRDLFVAVLLGINGDPGIVDCSDMNGDGLANGEDIQLFVAALLGE